MESAEHALLIEEPADAVAVPGASKTLLIAQDEEAGDVMVVEQIHVALDGAEARRAGPPGRTA